MNIKTPRTDAKAARILAEFGPNNNVRFAAMADFARELEKEINAGPQIKLSEYEQIECGKRIAETLGLKMSSDYRNRWETSWGAESALDIYRAIFLLIHSDADDKL